MKKIVCLCLSLALLLCLCACAKKQEEDGQRTTVSQAEDPTNIQTPYLQLSFPEEWRPYLRCEIIQDQDAYTLAYYAQLTGKDEVSLFELIFGSSDAYLLGMLTTESGQIGVYVRSFSWEFDETWSEQERYNIMAMENLINTALDQLLELETFTIA